MTKKERMEFYGQKFKNICQYSAVFAVSDYYAIDMMCFLQEHGVTVPGDISVAGFDDIPMCSMVSPTLTTVRQDGALRARLSIRKLRELKENAQIDPEIKLPVSLVVRNSTKEYRP